MRLFFQNIRGANGKCHLIYPMSCAQTYDVICFVETWLQPGFADSELLPTDHYMVFRCDRKLELAGKSTGGGVLVATKASLCAKRLPKFELPELEIVWVRLETEIPVYVCCVYLPNRSSAGAYLNFIKSLQDNIAAIEENDFRILICGDFNLSTINWLLKADGSLEPFDYLANDLHGTNSELIHGMNCFNLQQFNRLTNSNNRILDLALSDIDPAMIKCSTPVLPLCSIVDTHHPPYQLDIDIAKPRFLIENEILRYNYPKGDYVAINAELQSIDWAAELVGDVDSMLTKFYALVMVIISRFVPLKGRRYGQYPIWFSTALIMTLRKKNKFHRLFKRTGDHEAQQKFKFFRNKARNMIPSCYSRYVRTVEHNMRYHMKEFWRFTKSLKKTNSYPTSMSLNTGNGSLETSDSECIANLFAHHFNSAFSSGVPPDSTPPPTKTDIIFSGLSFSSNDVEEVLQKLQLDKGAGVDGISNYFLFRTSATIAIPLSLIFNASLRSGIFPSALKKTIIHPIFKKGDPHDIENYRPIAILNAIAKVFERLVHRTLLFHVKPHLNEAQHGFLPRKSTVTNLLEYVTFLAEALDKKEQVDVLYLDLSKAFDKISHQMMVLRLQSFGVIGSLLSWFSSYLSGRELQVVFNGRNSETIVPESGVPQGSILGPLLFVIYVDELLGVLESFKLFFADDGKLAKVIHSESDCRHLQGDLWAVHHWCSMNCMPVNPAKCSSMTVTNKNISAIAHNYTFVDGTPVARQTSTKDLGVMIDNKLRFTEQVDAVANKAFKTLGFVMRTSRHFHSLDAVLHLFHMLVLPHLDYACVIWSPFYATHIATIERVQRRFTRFVYRKFRLPYSDYHTRCRQLKLLPLDRRREYLEQQLLFNITNGLSAVQSSVANISYRTDRSTRNRQLFVEKTWRLNSSYYAPIPRMLRGYNNKFSDIDIFHLKKPAYNKAIYDTIFN